MRLAAIDFSPCASEATVRRPRPCDPGKFPWPCSDPAFPFHHAHARDSLSHFSASSSAERARCDHLYASRTEHMHRASDNARRCNALAGNFAPRRLWQHAITVCHWRFDPFHGILARAVRLMQKLRTLLCHRLVSSPDPCWVDEYLNGRPNISHTCQGFPAHH